MKTASEFLNILKNHCAYRSDWLKNKGCFYKAQGFDEILEKIEQFEAEQKKVGDEN